MSWPVVQAEFQNTNRETTTRQRNDAKVLDTSLEQRVLRLAGTKGAARVPCQFRIWLWAGYRTRRVGVGTAQKSRVRPGLGDSNPRTEDHVVYSGNDD